MHNELSFICNAVAYCQQGDGNRAWSLDQLDIAVLANLALRHGLIGCTYRYAQYVTGSKSDSAGLQHLKMLHSKTHLHQSMLGRQLSGLNDGLREADVEFLLFKGVAAKSQLSELAVDALRACTDIDLLVNPRDFPAAVEVLERHGYGCLDCSNASAIANFAVDHSDWLTKRGLVFRSQAGGLKGIDRDIDLHWRMANRFSLPFSTEQVFNSKQQIEIAGVANPIAVPCFEHHLALLCIHGYLDQFFQLKHLADIFFATRHSGFQRQLLFDLAGQLGVEQHIGDSLNLADTIFAPQEADPVGHYAKQVIKRLHDYRGIPPRMHKNQAEWSLSDKVSYIGYQMQTRSRRASLWSPVLNRACYKFDMVPDSPVRSPLLRLPLAWLSRHRPSS